MSLRINLNSAALSASRYLGANDNALGKSIEKLSSGYRVNSAADDPAGLVISQKLRAQIGGLAQAITNSNDATNMVKTAEGAMNETQSLLLSMRALAVHAANTGANDAASRQADQLQISSAIDSLNRISANTQFGNSKLLDGSAGSVATIVDVADISSASFNGMSTPTGAVGVQVTTAATQAKLATADNYATVNTALTTDATVTINGHQFAFTALGDTVATAMQKINNANVGVTATYAGGKLTLTDTTGYGSTHSFTYAETADVFNGNANATATGTNAVATVTYTGGTTETFSSGKGLQLIGNTSGSVINLTAAGGALGNHAGAINVTSNHMTFQVGAYAGQTVDFSLNSMAANKLGVTAIDLSGVANGATTVAGIDVTSQAGAQDAMKLIDAAMTEVSTARANLGAFQKNILESNVNSLSIAKENIAASESSIRDTDMAAEMVNFTKSQILNQAGVSMLAQANQAPQALLKLLG